MRLLAEVAIGWSILILLLVRFYQMVKWPGDER